MSVETKYKMRNISKIKVSFSGGRTSFMMTDLLLKKYPDSDFLITFANTGLEHPATLDFVRDADDYWGGCHSLAGS